MNRRLLLTFSTCLCLYGLYSVYAHFVSPLFAPAPEEPAVVKESFQHESHPRVNREAAERYLRDTSWAADASYQVRTVEGTYVFAEEWAPVEATGEVRLKPFAMIWRREGDPVDKEPITIVADSARVQFASRVDVTNVSNPRPGRLVGGALEGDVRIRGADGLLVQGKNFVFSESALRIWSDNPVSFAYGLNQGSGHGLELDLLPETVRLSADKPGVSGLRMVRLRKNVRMDLRSDPKPDVQGKGPASKGEQVQISSAGTFEYSVEAHIATFQNDVQVVHPTGPKQSDTLRCDLLTLIFEGAAPKPAVPGVAPVPGAAAEPAAAPAGPMGLGKDLTFRRLRGEGKVVTLVSQRSALQAEMMELTYDAQSRVITMQDGKLVKVFQENNEISCPEITVEHTEDGKLVKAICRGAGKLKSFTPAKTGEARRGPLAFSAEWLRQLQKHADTTPGLDVIEFEGHAKLHQPGQMELEADIVRIWITQDAGKPLLDTSIAKKQTETKGPPVTVKRLLAREKVAFASPQLIGQTDRLEVWFEDGKLPLVRPAEVEELESRSGPVPRPVLQAAASPARERPVNGTRPGRPLEAVERPPQKRQVALKPGRLGRAQSFAAVDDPLTIAAHPDKSARTGTGKVAAPPAGSSPPAIPLHVSATLIRLRAVRDGDKTDAAEIWNEGKVHVTQDRKPGEAPFDLQGERLHVRKYSELDQVIRLIGSPAQIKDGGMQLEGPDINLDRGKNTARVDGPGTLRLPASKTLDGKALDKPQMLDVWWKEQMQFDGELATFFVDVKAVLGESRMKCQEMQVTFSKRISFADTKAPPAGGDAVQVAQVLCKEGVEVENYEYLGTRLIGIHKASAWEFSLSQTTGDMQGQGPGSLLSWRRGNGKRAGMTGTAGVQANRPLQTENVEWEYTRIDFAGAMQGNVSGAFKGTTQDRVTTFNDSVLVVYGPVERTTDQIDPDNLPKDGGWMSCKALRLTQHAGSQTQPAYIDMLGTGNAELDGRSFHAKADSISFDESKKLYLLQSHGNESATIWRQTKSGARPNAERAKRMIYSPIDNRLRLEEATGLEWVE